MAKDAESGKVKKGSKGLGHWRCSACHKATKVTVSKAVPKEVLLGKTDVTPNIT